MGKIPTPYGISYKIHGHNGENGIERIPHCHVMCQGYRISISLNDGSIIAGSGQIDRNKEREILAWISSNLYELRKEWDEKSDPHR